MKGRLAYSLRLLLLAMFLGGLIWPMLSQSEPLSADTTIRVSHDEKAFIARLAPQAKVLGKAYGVSPSLLLAQASLESDFGRTLLGARYHNLYRMPVLEGRVGVTLQVVHVKDNQKTMTEETYQVYASWDDSLSDYLKQLRAGRIGQKDLYKDLATAKTLEQAAQALVSGGIAPDKAYANKLLEIIRDYRLEAYDKD